MESLRSGQDRAVRTNLSFADPTSNDDGNLINLLGLKPGDITPLSENRLRRSQGAAEPGLGKGAFGTLVACVVYHVRKVWASVSPNLGARELIATSTSGTNTAVDS